MELLRVEELSDGEKRYIYKIDYPLYAYSSLLFESREWVINRVRVTIAGETMLPDTTVYIKNMYELGGLMQKEQVLTCAFCGNKDKDKVQIVVDFSMNKVYIKAKREVAEKMIRIGIDL